ncbi:ATP-binding protein [Streptomyces sp. NPDC016675]|uniref:ATP-binding protein n=1 Tax=Streptomyces sp. NPDC016675 TaxID=3364970 RepID=UPI0036FC831B
MGHMRADALPDCHETRPDPPAMGVWESGPEVPRAARNLVREVLRRGEPPMRGDKLDDVCLIVSELVTNAYRYGGEPGDAVMVVVLPSADHIRVEVHDTRRKRPHLRTESDERARGRGLHLVELLATRWDTFERPFGKAVWAEVAR